MFLWLCNGPKVQEILILPSAHHASSRESPNQRIRWGTATISALAALPGTAGQLQFHLGASMNTGLTEAQIKHFVAVVEDKVGKQEVQIAAEVLDKVLATRR